jgi:O-acetyl-ADP-ribose deacetylase (regulator of RNase III)/NAD-dependent SIR2 family protein deacetylase
MIISDAEAIRLVLPQREVAASERHPRFACYLGAGVSVEADVKTASEIANEIRNGLAEGLTPDAVKQLEKSLQWDDSTLRYVTCIKRRYPDIALRVDYFRNLVKGLTPSFAHHAVALLMKHRYLRSTCLTTNFDKLLESAFVRQEDAEIQPIRTDGEVEFWANDDGRNYVLKLHGDYGTQNVANTVSETTLISDAFRDAVCTTLDSAGLVVLGTAGHEKSVHTLFDYLTRKGAPRKLLQFGVLWGVYVGDAKPAEISDADVKRLVEEKLEGEQVASDIRNMMKENAPTRLFRFFPVWRAGRFLYDLINATANRELIGTAERYLDRELRIRHAFTKAQLPPDAIDKHIEQLRRKRTTTRQPPPVQVAKVRDANGVEVRILYGDITSRTFMNSPELQSLRRAVISPDDTFITAGGGVAESLMAKAGKQFILNELAKFTPIEQGTVAVTSAGNLPVHYVFHAAAIKVERDATYTVSKDSVYNATFAALEKAAALDIGALWIPLMGAGLAGLQPEQSLAGALEAIRDWAPRASKPIIIMILIYSFTTIDKSVVDEAMRTTLALRFASP